MNVLNFCARNYAAASKSPGLSVADMEKTQTLIFTALLKPTATEDSYEAAMQSCLKILQSVRSDH